MLSFLRVWKALNLEPIKNALLVVGELSNQCFSCKYIGVDTHAKFCPQCGCEFKYIGFRRKIDSAYLRKLKESHSQLTFIDFNDFKKALEKKEARKILDI